MRGLVLRFVGLGMSQGSPHEGALERWLEPNQPGGLGVLCHGDALASHLKLKQCGPKVFQGTLSMCHLDTKGGAVVSTDQRCPGVHHPGAILVGWLEVVWARDPRLTGVG